MKKRIFISLSAFIFYLLSFSYISADFSESLSAYNTAYEKYRVSYQNFLKAKNSYLKYQTLSSQTEALNQTKLFLENRDYVLISYYTVLLNKVNQTAGFLPYEKNLQVYNLTNRLAFFNQHLLSISPLSSLEDCVDKSKDLEKIKYELEVESYKTVGLIVKGNIKEQADLLSLYITDLTNLVNQIKGTGKNVEKLERWLLETNYKYELGQKKIAEAYELLNSLDAKNPSQIKEIFLQSKKMLASGNQYFKEAGYNAGETIKEIKTLPY